MARVEALTKLLGGKQVLGRTVTSRFELVPLVREGLPYQALEAITRKLDLSVDATTKSLQLPKRTLSRRKKSQRLDALQSERVLRLAHVATRATEILGSETRARSWLLAENRALGGDRPIDLLDTDIGTQAVEDVLVRVEHGVFS
ncbi:antitoxin Xre/MbcA/ParS toxin-binding domain-containing protein [Pendulispora albinea]|uniref:DUF2384 domain-containing protein n=1 Tax=Pendulispora albinea TaxID=2741071 RepID=A0ABZ2LRS4_9BACT